MIYLVMQSPHELHIHTSETMTTGGEEVETHMDSVVRDGDSPHPGLCLQEDVELFINILNDGLPAVGVVHTVTKT